MLLEGKRVFLVEDNQGNAAIIQLLLEQDGAKVLRGRWTGDITSLLSKKMPLDAILLDLMLPHGVTGYDLFDQIRKDSKFDGIPVVAVSASDPAGAISKVRKQGFAGFIAKPVNFENFAEQIATILGGEQVWYTGHNIDV